MDRNLEIVRLLADGELHSGEAIAARLGISRAAVWKAVRKAADVLDLNLDSVRGHGYRLRTPLELLDADAIRRDLPAPSAIADQRHRRAGRGRLNQQLADATRARRGVRAAASVWRSSRPPGAVVLGVPGCRRSAPMSTCRCSGAIRWHRRSSAA